MMQPKQERFCDALRSARVAQGLTVRDIARRVCVKEERINDWENGEAVPTGIEFTRLVGSLRRLEPYRHSIREMNNPSEKKATLSAPLSERVPALASTKPFVPPPEQSQKLVQVQRVTKPAEQPFLSRLENRPTPSAPPLPAAAAAAAPVAPAPAPVEIPPRSFGEALYQARTRAKLTPTELSELLGVTAQSVNSWERGDTTPSEENLTQIYTLLEPHGLKMRVKANRTRAVNGYTTTVQKAAPVVPGDITTMSAEDLKKTYGEAVKRVAEIQNEMKTRRERFLAMANELEIE